MSKSLHALAPLELPEKVVKVTGRRLFVALQSQQL
jgi:hypothetical protein